LDATKTTALVYIEKWCGPICGRGETHFLVKPGIDWREADWRDVGEYFNMCDWVS
jgi:hypothetical protein